MPYTLRIIQLETTYYRYHYDKHRTDSVAPGQNVWDFVDKIINVFSRKKVVGVLIFHNIFKAITKQKDSNLNILYH